MPADAFSIESFGLSTDAPEGLLSAFEKKLKKSLLPPEAETSALALFRAPAVSKAWTGSGPKNGRLLVAFDKGVAVGTASFFLVSTEPAQYHGVIAGVYVPQRYRHRGIGRLLLSEALVVARSYPGLPSRLQHLMAHIQPGTQGVGFFTRHGFRLREPGLYSNVL